MFYCSRIIFKGFKHADIKDVGSMSKAQHPLLMGIVSMCEQYIKSLGLTASGFDFLFHTRPCVLWQQLIT